MWLGKKEKNNAQHLKKIRQCKICFNELVGFLKISISLKVRLAANPHLTLGVLLLLANKKRSS